MLTGNEMKLFDLDQSSQTSDILPFIRSWKIFTKKCFTTDPHECFVSGSGIPSQNVEFSQSNFRITEQ